MRVVTWLGRRWRAEEWRDGWRLSHGDPETGYGLILSRASLDEVAARLLAEGVDPVADVDGEPRRPQ